MAKKKNAGISGDMPSFSDAATTKKNHFETVKVFGMASSILHFMSLS